ncbi:EamA family transporter RarD [Azospirillum picis]|uniref:Chloramphenicol-sensitive protein RarD n=1 Tax=Azospirillum picis TaxID=488438 RepID=A0ABU0MF92_9PROT|nr:EamA family transporter RarD [Azospirillum picis]MBP2298273.1 chloramphenicol-sensitive protein RarD [Azospirillum picis]MDQ0532110.1 chloramphenicol-sensitive protein RarD [Azospirillum picis]
MVETLPAAKAPNTKAAAFIAALSSYLVWGLLNPIFFKALHGIGPLEIVAHRVLWTVVLVGGAVLATRGGGAIVAAVGSWRRLGVLLVTTLLITINWTVFIWAVVNSRLVEASIGYFMNPLVNVLLGVLFLNERLSRGQMLAVAIATAGVGIQVASYGTIPWVALSLALSFGFYAAVRKKAAIDPVIGLLVETALLLPAALGYLLWLGDGGAFGHGWADSVLLALSGPVTAVPLVLFMFGAANLTLTTVGLLQYVSPTGQLLLGVLVFGEAFTRTHAVTFACIWAALAVFTVDAIRNRRASTRRVREATTAPAATAPAAD